VFGAGQPEGKTPATLAAGDVGVGASGTNGVGGTTVRGAADGLTG